MERKFPEADWRKLRALHGEVLARFCTRALSDLRVLLEASDTRGGAPETFLEVYEHIKTVDTKRSRLFDDMRRSMAFFMLAAWVKAGLLTEEELGSFSEGTRDLLQQVLGPASSNRADG